MTEKALKCPQCGGPLQPGRFARIAVCPHCGSTISLDEQTVEAEHFRKAFRDWDFPPNNGFTEWLTVNGMHWAVGRKIAGGHISDAYFGLRARWPTECILLKILRNPGEVGRFQNTWKTLVHLNQSMAPGAETFSKLTPQPVFAGKIESGEFAGTHAMAFRWANGFNHTLGGVKKAYPSGIPPRSSIWLWRRILEILTFIHSSGLVHGSVLPPHLLLEEGEHGIRLVGYGCAGESGAPLQHILPRFENYYPKASSRPMKLTPALDITMSAKTMASVLGGDPATGNVPDIVPAPLAGLIYETANGRGSSTGGDAWTLRQRLGRLAQEVYGAPKFCPIVMREKED
ncbi:MAG: inactive serine/threonine-protein kinase VRK3 [Acidobacteriota bacterium]|jgi:hypothetical protein